MRWWGWGDPARPPALGPRALELVRETVGTAGDSERLARDPPVALGGVRLEPSAAPAGRPHRVARGCSARRRCARTTPSAWRTRPARATRTSCACARASPRARPTRWCTRPTRSSYARSCRLCARRSLAVVPFGGGTSVVGGVAPLRGEHAAVIALDVRRLGSSCGWTGESRIVTVQAGMRVPALERRLAAESLTLGHFPQSYEHVSLGGCAATRSAGQASTGYGRFEELVLGLRDERPGGGGGAAGAPGERRGPGPAPPRGGLGGHRGSDRTSSTCACAPRRRPTHYEGVFFEDFQAGVEALRALAQERTAPAVARLSDEAETRVSLAQASAGAAGARALKGRLGAGVPRPAWLPHGLPGDPRLRGRPGGVGAPPQAGARADPRPRRPAGGARAGGGVARAALRGPVPARRAADARGDGRDAGDRDPLVEPPAAAPRDGPRDRRAR